MSPISQSLKPDPEYIIVDLSVLLKLQNTMTYIDLSNFTNTTKSEIHDERILYSVV